MAKIPPHRLEDHSIGQLPIGKTGYVVSWAIYIDEDYNSLLLRAYTYEEKPHGTAHVHIKRISETSFEILDSSVKPDYKYEPRVENDLHHPDTDFEAVFVKHFS